LLARDQVRSPSEVFWYDNGPGHTIDFIPDSYVDVTDEWPAAVEWLGGLMAFVRNGPFDIQKDAAVETKTILSRYRGLACGVKYAEAVKAVRPVVRDL
jgi:hypothetical protein